MMGNHLDAITHRPIGEWRISPPEVHVAENGFVLRTYDMATDAMRYRIAATVGELRVALQAWADELCDQIQKGTERHIAQAVEKRPA